MKIPILLTCILCGNTFAPGNDKDGIPNGLGFTMKSGETYHICKKCMMHRYEEAIKLIESKEADHDG